MTLPAHNDPLGHALLDYMQNPQKMWIEVRSDVGAKDKYDVAYYFRDWNKLPDWEKQVIELCKGPVLDIGAGSGVHTLILEQKNIEVVAIDVSPGAVEVMRHRGVKNVLLEDIWGYKGHPFQTLLLLMNGIGIVGSYEGLDRFLAYAKDLLLPGGTILLDSSDISYMLDDETFVRKSAEQNVRLGEVQFQMCYKQIVGEVFPWLYVDFTTLCQYAEQHGYQCQLIAEGPHYQYAASLHLPSGTNPVKKP